LLLLLLLLLLLSREVTMAVLGCKALCARFSLIEEVFERHVGWYDEEEH